MKLRLDVVPNEADGRWAFVLTSRDGTASKRVSSYLTRAGAWVAGFLEAWRDECKTPGRWS